MRELHEWQSMRGSPPERAILCTCGEYFPEIELWQFHHTHTLQHINRECGCWTKEQKAAFVTEAEKELGHDVK